jgi:hypothetical protein
MFIRLRFPNHGEEIIARMIEFGEVLGQANFNYLRETYPDHSVHYFWFNQSSDLTAFQCKFADNIGPDVDNAVADLSFKATSTA